MASAKSFPLVRGRMMRVTKTDGCCGPAYGPDNSITTEGFVSVALTANITDAEEITVTNANGKTCVRDSGEPTFDGYGVEITFCEVQPCLFSLVTGQPVVTNAAGEIIGFKMNSKVSLQGAGFALEVWMGVPGVACEGGESNSSGYLLLPCLQGGVIGDFTIENAAVTFSVTGANTKDGNAWGVGPYADSILPDPLDVNDHLYVIYSTTPIPAATDGCMSLVPSGMQLSVVGNIATVTLARGGDDCFDNAGVVDWGDATAPESFTDAVPTLTHDYTTAGPGNYEIVVAHEDCGDVTFNAVIV